MHPDFIELLDYALKKTIAIHMSTNGTLVDSRHFKVLGRCAFVNFSVHNRLGFERAKEFLKSKSSAGPVVQISFVRGEETTRDIYDKIVNSGKLEGFDSLRVYEEHSLGGVFGKSNLATKAERKFCPKLQDTLVVAFDGSLSRCNHIWDTEPGSNIKKMDIIQAWEREKLKQVRRGYPDSQCAGCDQWIGHTSGEAYRLTGGKLEHIIYSPEGITYV